MTVTLLVEPISGNGPYAIPGCGICSHTTPAGMICLLCQPNPNYRCPGCAHGSPVPTVDQPPIDPPPEPVAVP